MKKTIYILATGGTISAAGAEGMSAQYQDGAFDITALLEKIPGLEEIADIRGKQVLNIASQDITWAHWQLLAHQINTLAKDPEISGFVLTHGTNTMEETAFFLNLTVKTEKPVVLTGSMRPATAMSADGTMNLYEAIALAAQDEAVGRGVLVCFADGIYSARDVQKVNSFRTQAFSARDFGCIGLMQDHRAFFTQSTVKPHTLQSEFDAEEAERIPRVDVVDFCADAAPDLLAYSAAHAAGIVLAGVGSGQCSDAWKAEIKRCTERGVPVIRTTRTACGVVTWDRVDAECGSLPGYTLPASKLRILLALILQKTKDPAELHACLQRY